MKHLILTMGFPPQTGGIQTILYEITRRLSGERIVLTYEYTDSEKFDAKQPFKIFRRKKNFFDRVSYFFLSKLHPIVPLTTSFLFSTLNIVRRNDIRIVHCGHVYMGFLGFIIKKLFRKPYFVYTYAQEVMEKSLPKNKIVSRWLGNVILRNAAKIITISNFTKEEILKWGISEDKVAKIPMGADFDIFKPDEIKRDSIIKEYSLNGNKILLTVSRLEKRKGHDMVLKSLPTVLNFFPKIKYLIVGEGEYKEELEKIVDKLGLNNNVMFMGELQKEKLSFFYNAADVFIMPSRDLAEEGEIEGFGVVFLEANACEKPVIGGRSGGVPDAIVDGETGILVDPESIEEISNALITLLKNKKLAKKMGENGRRRVVEEYNWENAVGMIEVLISETLGEK